jgi:hypothetical protein
MYYVRGKKERFESKEQDEQKAYQNYLKDKLREHFNNLWNILFVNKQCFKNILFLNYEPFNVFRSSSWDIPKWLDIQESLT